MMDEAVATECRFRMVERLRERGIADDSVLEAMGETPRHRFVPGVGIPEAYADGALPIGEGQTMSMPWIVAFMASAATLTTDDVVLEVGGGCGYSAAVLSRLCRTVVTIELLPRLARVAAETLGELGYNNVEVRVGDGSGGLPEQAPFNAIVVAAMADAVPTALIDQLVLGGTLVCPVGHRGIGHLVRVREGNVEELTQAGFVPLVTGSA